MALFAAWSQEEGICAVEALGQKVGGALPLSRIQVQSSHVDHDSVTGLDEILTNFGVFRELVGRRYEDGWS